MLHAIQPSHLADQCTCSGGWDSLVLLLPALTGVVLGLALVGGAFVFWNSARADRWRDRRRARRRRRAS